jgi:peroxiredoxin
MANVLTGEFDIVAEFAVPAVNRVLAAMHRCERFPHSLSVRVDDNAPPGSKVDRPTMVGSVDSFGDPIVDHGRIGNPNPFPGGLAATSAVVAGLDVLVNGDMVAVDVPIVPSHLQGRAQLQLAPPVIDVTDASGNRITVRLPVRARYFPDPQTSPLAEFIRGELRITAAVNQAVSQVANIVDVDFKADQAYINFTPAWSSRPLSAGDLAGINLLIRNAMKTSFLPSNTTLPANIAYAQFKTLLGAPNAVGLLLNMSPSSFRGNASSMNNISLSAEDDFAFAAGRDFVLAAFQPILDDLLSRPIDPVTIHVSILWHTSNVTYAIALKSATADLQQDKIVLTFKGHAHTGTSWMPDFDFTVRQELGLAVSGANVNLVVGNVSLDTSSWVVNLFKSAALDNIGKVRDQALIQSGAQAKVNQMLSADKNLGGLLKSLLNPAQPKPGVPPPQDVNTFLAYTSADINPTGIVMHGSLAVSDWPAAHVEFQEIPSTGPLADHGLDFGPDYSALKSWIPGGTIEGFEWAPNGPGSPATSDDNRFVLLSAPIVAPGTAVSARVLPGYSPMCLTLRGVRLSSSGPVVQQTVVATVCGYNSFPIVDGANLASAEAVPLVALGEPGHDGRLQVTGHTSAQIDRVACRIPNLVVHFADAQTAGQLQRLTEALRESECQDAPTAVLAVLDPEDLANARYSPGIVYGDNQNHSWEEILRLKRAKNPLTLIIHPGGKVAWRQEGEIDVSTLGAALKKNLVSGEPVKQQLLRPNLRLGRPAPNFLFELTTGHGLTLRKLAGRPLILVFWKSSSQPSIEAVRAWQKNSGNVIVLAINDGEDPELARKVFADNKLSATLVTDPKREIAIAYGVHIWPSVISVDASGVVIGIRQGHLEGEPGTSAARQEAAASA